MFKKFNAGKVGLFVAGLAFGQQVSKSLQAKMLRKFIQVALLLYCVPKIP